MEIGPFIGLAEVVLAFNLDVVEQRRQREPFDLGALGRGSAVGDKRQQDATRLQRFDGFPGAGKERGQLVAEGREPRRDALRQVRRQGRRTGGRERFGDHLPARLGHPKTRDLVALRIRPERGERGVQPLGDLVRKERLQFGRELTGDVLENLQPLTRRQDGVVEIEENRTRQRGGGHPAHQ